MYYGTQILEQVRRIDLLTYMERAFPDNLKREGSKGYRLRDHDSVTISGGLWKRWATGDRGSTALDYLIKVENRPFTECVAELVDLFNIEQGTDIEPYTPERRVLPVTQNEKKLITPKWNSNCTATWDYLVNQRKLDKATVYFCLQKGYIKETRDWNNAAFIGYGYKNKDKMKYVMKRGTIGKFRGECSGSDKRYPFRLVNEKNKIVHLYESPIDLLSYVSLRRMENIPVKDENFLSLGGVSGDANSREIPVGLDEYLKTIDTETVVLNLDYDKAGLLAGDNISKQLGGELDVEWEYPPAGKDYNEFLCDHYPDKKDYLFGVYRQG